jgi:hypothetical protein
MRRMTQMLAIAGLACVASLGSNKAWAQQDNGGGGKRNFDPAQFQQQRMERIKEDLEVKDDEWTALQPLIQKVMDAQQAVMADRMRGAFRGFRNRGGDNNGGGGGDNGGRRRGFGGEPSPEAQALEKAIESKASNSEMKAALAKLQESRKAKQADLETAQANLKKVLSVRQEAILTAQGLL